MSKPLRWFAPKRIGWGIRPIHPMGYVVLVVSIVGFASGLNLILLGSSLFHGSILILFSIVFFAFASYFTLGK